MPEFEKVKCEFCKSTYERVKGHVGQACPECFRKQYIEYSDGSFEKRDKPFEANKDYKKELQGVTHRGKNKVK